MDRVRDDGGITSTFFTRTQLGEEGKLCGDWTMKGLNCKRKGKMKVCRWGFCWERRYLGQIIYVRERVRVQQNWVTARRLMSMMGDKTRLENIKG